MNMLLEKDFVEYLRNKLSPKTTKNYLAILDNLEVSKNDILNKKSLELARVLNKFIERKWTRLFAIKNLLIFYGRNDVLPFLIKPRSIKRPRRISKKSLPFSKIKQAAKIAKNDEIRLIIMLHYETGARIGELLSITKDSIDFETKTITVGGEKGSESRTIKLSPPTFNLLKKLLPKLFPHSYHYYLKWVKVAFGNELVSTHWLRFSRAVHLFNKGYDVITIKNLLGHRNLQSTYSYLKEAGIELRELAEKEKPDWE